MATIAIAQSRRSSPLPVVLFILLAIAAVTIVYFFNEHAAVRHGTDVEAVDRCFERMPEPFLRVGSPDGRLWELCRISDHLVGLRLYCLTYDGLADTMCKKPVTSWKMTPGRMVRLLLKNNAINDEMAAKILTEFMP